MYTFRINDVIDLLMMVDCHLLLIVAVLLMVFYMRLARHVNEIVILNKLPSAFGNNKNARKNLLIWL